MSPVLRQINRIVYRMMMKPPKSVNTILVRAPNWIGDQIMAYPFFYYLRRAYPSARIMSVCVEWVKDLQFRALVDDVYVLPQPPGGAGLLDKFRVLEESAKAVMTRGPWDLGISLPNSLSSAWLIFRARTAIRRGYRVDGRGLFLNDGVSWDRSPVRHRAGAYVDLLPESARAGVSRQVTEFWGVPPENDLDQATPGELKSFDVTHEWPDSQPIAPPPEPYWVLAPGSKAESRRYSIESYERLAMRVFDATGWKGLVVGGDGEADLIKRLCDENPKILINLANNMTGDSQVSALWKIFRSAKFTVSNESGLAHMGALCGSMVQIICGAADPRRTRPLGPGRVQVSVNPVDCWPCERNRCFQTGGRQLQCLRGIDPDSVWMEIERGIGINSNNYGN